MVPGLPVVLVLGLLAVIVFAFHFLRRVALATVAEATATITAEGILRTAASANFFGQQSSGIAQIRGNGFLALTNSRIYFLSIYSPRREISITWDRVVGVEKPRSFLGKTKFRPLLKIVFRNENGERDAAAWLVSDTDGWIAAVRERANIPEE